MKDPLDEKRRAYDVLGLPLGATLAEINAAYTRLSADRKNARRRQEITDAWQRLRRLQTRLEEDVWYYEITMPTEALQTETEPELPVIAPEFPPVTLGREVTDLHGGRAARLQSPICFREVRISYIRGFHDDPEWPDPVKFDS